jgi:hypothetical protein
MTIGITTLRIKIQKCLSQQHGHLLMSVVMVSVFMVCRGVIRKWLKTGPKLSISNNKIFPKDKRTSLLCPGVNFDPGKFNNIWRRMLQISSWPLL